MTTLEEFRELVARGEALPDDSEVHAFMVETGECTRRLLKKQANYSAKRASVSRELSPHTSNEPTRH